MVKKETKKIKITDVRGNTYDGKRKKKGKITLQADRKRNQQKKRKKPTRRPPECAWEKKQVNLRSLGQY
jgi:hypothetical protein